MRMNSGIILAGQGVNALGAMQDGMQTAAMGKAIQKENRLADLYRTQGAGIAQGDRGALNALAGIDPQAAMAADAARLDRESATLGMESTRQRMRILDAQEARTIAAQAAEMDANQRKAAADQLNEAVRMGMAAQTPQEWDALMGQLGRDDLVGQFGNRQALAYRAMDMADILRSQEPPKPADEYQRYVQEEQAAGRTPLDRIGYANAKKGNGITLTNPDGTSIQIGGAAKSVKLTEGQAKDNVYVTRAKGALELLEGSAEALTSRVDRSLDMVPMGIGREGQTQEFQIAQQAGEEFLQAILRKDTGAAITTQEQDMYGKTFLPQPGDGPAVLEAKRASRQRAVAAIEAGMSAEQILITEKALVSAAEKTTQAQERFGPKEGEVQDGYRFKGGDPADPNNWERE